MAWLGLLRGTPLSGLEDAGTRRFSLWLDGQRQRLGDLTEDRLETAHTRAQAAGQWQQAALILRRASSLGQEWAAVAQRSGELQPGHIQAGHSQAVHSQPVQIQPVRTHPVHIQPAQPQPTELQGAKPQPVPGEGGWPVASASLYADALRAVGEATEASVTRPQLLLISGLSGHRWQLLMQTIRPEDRWLHLSLETVSSTQMLLASVAMQLLPQVPAALQAEVRGTLQQGNDPETLLVRLGSVVMACNQPLLLVLNSAESLPVGVFALLKYIMNWPMQVLVVLIGSADAAPRLVRTLHASLPSERLHHVALPRLTPAALAELAGLPGRLPEQKLAEQKLMEQEEVHAALTSGSDRSYAQNNVAHSRHLGPADPASLQLLLTVQQSEGWPLAAAELFAGALNRESIPGRPSRATLPESLRRSLIAQVDSVMPEQRLLLARLAALPAPFSLDSATAALGTPAREASLAASAEGFLERVPPVIRLDLPSLGWRTPDGEYPLAFTSELRRAALAGSLPQDERQRLRSVGRIPGTSVPDVGIPHAATPSSAELSSGGSPMLTGPGAAGVSGSDVGAPPVGRRPPPSGRRSGSSPPAGRRSVWLPGGYHVILENGQLHVLRLSWGEAPTLQMSWAPDPATHSADGAGCEWRLTARIDAFAGTGAEFALQVQCGEQRETLTVRPTVLGQWLTFCGRSDQPFGSLNVRAADLILTLGGVWIGGQPALPHVFGSPELVAEAALPTC